MLPGGYSSMLKAKDRDKFRDEIIRALIVFGNAWTFGRAVQR